MGNIRRGRYDWVSGFHEGRAVVRINWKYGVIDSDGKVVVPLIYEWVDRFYHGRAIVQIDGQYGLVNCDGKEVVPPMYDIIDDFSEGRATVRLNGMYGFIDLDGNTIIPCWYESIVRQPSGFMATHRVSIHDVEHLYFDRNGNQIKESTS
jgi:hypothetical protein